MKISIRQFIPIVSALALLAAAATPATAIAAKNPKNSPPPADEHDSDGEHDAGTTVRAKFSDPAKPGMLKLSLPWAEVRVTGTDGNEVVVTSTLNQKGKGEIDSEGFRRLDEEVTFELTEKNNVATIVIVGDNPWAAHDAEFDIKVPRNTNLSLQTETGGDVRVESVSGEIDVNSMNGEVTLIDPGSAVVVNTMNGEINTVFKTVPVKPVSLSSMNGEIALTLPGETKANLRMRSHNGSIRTNFSDSVLQSKNEARSEDSDGTPASAHAQRDVERAMRDAQRAMADADRATANAMAEAEKATRAAMAAPVATTTVVTVATPAPTPVAAPKAPKPPRAPRIPVPPFGGKSIVGTLNGGGIDIQLATMNGSITLRQSK